MVPFYRFLKGASMCLTISSEEVLDFCIELMYDAPSPRIIDYLAWSDNPGFNSDLCLESMLNRTPYDKIPVINFKPHEEKLFQRRFNTIASDNIFFDLITIVQPNVNQIEAAATQDQSYAILMPIKRFLIDHPLNAKVYYGFLPFGKEVKKYYNTIKFVKDNSWYIKSSPNFSDYLRLKRITNNMSNLSGIPTVTINTWMYKKGLQIQDNNQQ